MGSLQIPISSRCLGVPLRSQSHLGPSTPKYLVLLPPTNTAKKAVIIQENTLNQSSTKEHRGRLNDKNYILPKQALNKPHSIVPLVPSAHLGFAPWPGFRPSANCNERLVA